MKTPSKNPAKGFTLIELLVAMAITTIIITILVSVTSLSLDTWNRSRSEIRAARQGKAMIDSMARDFESLVVRKGNNFEWLAAKYTPTTAGPGSGSGNVSPNAAELVFFTAATDRYAGDIGGGNDNGGDVSTVAYRLSYKNPIDSDVNENFKTFVLYRKIINPDVTFQQTLGTLFVNLADGTLLGKASSVTAVTGTTAKGIDDETNFICENIYQFTTTFHIQVTIPGVAPAPARVVSVPVALGGSSGATGNFKVTGSGMHFDGSPSLPTGVTLDMLKAGRLSSVEVSLTVLTDFGLTQMRKRTFSNDTDKAEFIAKNTYQYSKVIPVPGS